MYDPRTKHRILQHPKLRLKQTPQPLVLHPQIIHLLPYQLPVPRALDDLQPRIPHLRLQGHVGQPPDLLRLGHDGPVLVPKLQVPWLKDGLEGVHGAVVFVPLE